MGLDGNGGTKWSLYNDNRQPKLNASPSVKAVIHHHLLSKFCWACRTAAMKNQATVLSKMPPTGTKTNKLAWIDVNDIGQWFKHSK